VTRTNVLSTTAAERAEAGLPAELDRLFEAIVFDWDGTAVPDRQADAARLRLLVEDLCAAGMDLAVITGTHVGNVDGQLQARPKGPGHLYLCMNRGSEVFAVGEDGPELVYRREATPEEDAALDASADATVAALAERGLRAEIVSQRLNRRKIDVIPLPEWFDPPKARIAELLAAVEHRLAEAGLRGLEEAVELAAGAAREAGLPDPRVTSDAKHVEIGLTDKSDAARWVFEELRRRGIAPGLVLVGGDEFGPLGGLQGSDSYLLVPEAARATAISVGAEPTGVPAGVLAVPGGPERFLEILEDQLERRRHGDVPDVDADPDWTLTVEGLDPELERVHESWLTLTDGRLGTRGSALLGHAAATPGVLAAGVYDGEGPETALAPLPEWARLPGQLPVDPLIRRRLDLRTGVLREELALEEGRLTALRLSSLARPGTVALRANAPASLLPHAGDRTSRAGLWTAMRDASHGPRLDRIAAYEREEDAARVRQAEAEEAGFERLLAEHREAWARRWDTADVVIDGDPELQRAIRFTVFHLIGSAASEGEAAVGARGLTGPAYRGHVFWDSDVFVLPFLAATHPPAARAMLEYRIRRLPAALAEARRLGRRGARFPWESAADGVDVTPASVRDHAGRLVRIRTGELEEHIVADVAWAACCYLDWTGDTAFAEGPGRELLMETARYWASRVRFDGLGAAHIYGIIGPDEYHEPVDDNAFTNVMARWNLRRAAEVAHGGSDATVRERERWLEIADALVDGYDAQSGLYEQFAGFHGLEPLVIAEIAPRRPIAADLLLGAERVSAAQVLKQADVLMLHHLVPDEVAPGSLVANLDFYEPRTAHSSSLSPAIHASLFARAGRMDESLTGLRLAARIDLDDLTGSTAGGLHLATMGGLWQALAFGFAGLRPKDDVLHVEPRLPSAWRALELRLRFRGSPVRLRIKPDAVTVDAGGPINVSVGDLTPSASTRLRFERSGENWKEVTA
jgi:trehalose/maltose hydrolase-like predicted phosphorylase